MTTYLFILFSFLWGNTQMNTPNISSMASLTVGYSTHINTVPTSEGIDRIGMIRKVLIQTWDRMRLRIRWWSDLLTITAVLWGVGLVLKLGSWLFLGSWADYVATILFVGGAVFFVIWFFQTAASLN